jgi:Uri superfamily endonuclease
MAVTRGAYQLLLRLRRGQTVPVGERLGPRRFPAGWYVYTGSAMGSGGIEARVRRHLDRAKTTRHWHIDYLTTHPEFAVVEVIRRPSRSRQECRINQATARLPGAAVPVPGFGNSDRGTARGCTCAAHLVHLRRRPTCAGGRREPAADVSRRPT